MSDPTDEWVEETVNLRRAQVNFLDALSQEMAVDISEVCRQIIDLALVDIDAKPPDDAIDDDRLAQDWTKRTIKLRADQIQGLAAWSAESGDSPSRLVRRLVTAFMEQPEPDGAEPDGAEPPIAGPDGAQPAPAPSRRLPSRRPPPRRPPPRRPVERAATPKPPPARTALFSMMENLLSRPGWLFVPVLVVLATAGIYVLLDDPDLVSPPIVRTPAVVTTVPWAGRDADILFDHHSHTVFSDGRLTPIGLVDKARNAGCNALAITDHGDTDDTVGERQLARLALLRLHHPGFLLFGGVEINMPSYGGREHANVIVDPAVEGEVLPRLKEVSEAAIAEARQDSARKASDEEFLRLAASYHARGDGLVMIYNHPSRKDRKAGENYTDILRWNAEAPLFIGFEGGPGHQNLSQPGDYQAPIFTTDRWDPVVAEIGGTWDRLLSEGHQLWGAIAGSDYHNRDLDKAPCDFSRTHIAAADFTHKAVLDALRAGTFWADHGQMLHRLSFSAQIDGLEFPVYPGAIVNLAGDTGGILASLTLKRGPGGVGAPLQVEFIGNCRTGKTELLEAQTLEPYSATAAATIQPSSAGADGKSCFIRARVRLEMGPEPDLMAYTNPIRFQLR